MGRLDQKVAIITGASQGIGKGIALALAGAGAAVVCAARTESKLVETAGEIEARGGRALPVVCDIRELDQIEACVARTVAHFGRLERTIRGQRRGELGLGSEKYSNVAAAARCLLQRE